MFIAMNRFKINLGFEEGFEKIWREREYVVSPFNSSTDVTAGRPNALKL